MGGRGHLPEPQHAEQSQGMLGEQVPSRETPIKHLLGVPFTAAAGTRNSTRPQQPEDPD